VVKGSAHILARVTNIRIMCRLAAVGVAGVVALALPASAAESAVAPLPRIAVVGGALVNSETGARFTPRGYNYVRLATPSGRFFHSTFEPGRYNATQVEAFLRQMQGDGYNAVRVFIDGGGLWDADAGVPHGIGNRMSDNTTGSPAYYDDVADFVRRAAVHGQYVIPIIDAFPQNGRYFNYQASFPPPTNPLGWPNSQYLSLQAIKTKNLYAQDFVTELRNRLGPLMSTLLAVELDNEAAYGADQAPFAQSSGVVTGPDGVRYDMAKPADRQQLADAGIVTYARYGAAGVRSVDPRLLVTVGTFTNAAVGKSGPDGLAVHCASGCSPTTDYRYPARALMLSQFAGLDFLDVHTYPGVGARTLGEDLASIEWDGVRGPVVMGEFGAYKPAFGNSVVTAAYGMRDREREGCAAGFQGFLFWSWDTTETADQQRFFTSAESGGAINGQLAPVVRPDACR
jgi:hypothetical protein